MTLLVESLSNGTGASTSIASDIFCCKRLHYCLLEPGRVEVPPALHTKLQWFQMVWTLECSDDGR
nr:hypothetical protein Iba_chr01cCG4160 [Ipomoea batatas]